MSLTSMQLDRAWRALRVGLAAGLFLAGLDKFFDLLTDWSMYLSPLVERLLPVGSTTFLRAAGVVEMLIAIALLSRFARVGAYVASAWLVAISLNLLVAGGFWDHALRDLEIALSAFVLGRLTAWHEARHPAPREEPHGPGMAHAGARAR